MKATQRLISLTNKSNYKLEVEAIGYRPDTEPIIVREKIGKKNKDIEYKDYTRINSGALALFYRVLCPPFFLVVYASSHTNTILDCFLLYNRIIFYVFVVYL